MKARIRSAYPETAVLLFMNEEKSAAVSSVMEKLGIRTLIPKRESCGETVGFLAGIDGFSGSGAEYTESEKIGELIIFAGITPKRLDRVLDALRSGGLSIRFKAMLTEYNKSMTIPELMEHLFAEEEKLRNNAK